MSKIKRTIMTLLAVAVAVIVAVGAAVLPESNAIQVEAAGRPVSITSCLISGANVNCQISASSVPSSDDGKYYIYADEVYQDGPTGKVVATVDAG